MAPFAPLIPPVRAVPGTGPLRMSRTSRSARAMASRWARLARHSDRRLQLASVRPRPASIWSCFQSPSRCVRANSKLLRATGFWPWQ